jgi:hypothetical protein
MQEEEEEEEILGSDDDEQEAPSDYCKVNNIYKWSFSFRILLMDPRSGIRKKLVRDQRAQKSAGSGFSALVETTVLRFRIRDPVPF